MRNAIIPLASANSSRPCTHCTRRGYNCLEPSCRACNQAGKAAECTHRETHDNIDVDKGNGTCYILRLPSPLDSTASASTPVSPLLSQPMMLPPSSSTDPQGMYEEYYYCSSQAQPTYPSQLSIPDTRLLPPPIPSVPLGQAYQPVIDPSLENQSE